MPVFSHNPELIGEMREYAGVSAPPMWLLCDGSAVSRDAYSDLFIIVGESYGVGDGSTTFNLPTLMNPSHIIRYSI